MSGHTSPCLVTNRHLSLPLALLAPTRLACWLAARNQRTTKLPPEWPTTTIVGADDNHSNERTNEWPAEQLQLLEQDKHKLKRKLDQLDGEYENRLIELQTDCNILKNQLDEQQQLARQAEKVSERQRKLGLVSFPFRFCFCFPIAFASAFVLPELNESLV